VNLNSNESFHADRFAACELRVVLPKGKEKDNLKATSIKTEKEGIKIL
jgi:hypothetical protein